MRSTLDGAEAKIKRAMRKDSKYQIAPDNRGVSWNNGSTLVWKDGKIHLGQAVLVENVDSFSLFRRDGITFATLSIQDPAIKAAESKQFIVEEAGYASRI